ncbi:hypothetical protein D3C80_1898110 [compost metagenome]
MHGHQQKRQGYELDTRHRDAGDKNDQRNVPGTGRPKLQYPAHDRAVGAAAEHLGIHDRQQIGRDVKRQCREHKGPRAGQ